ncbi:unnamed protein product [Spirodela intermedia]|uniref:Uncharacterized protein n=1 Tax=Spirodela intermedia TaxID=51605 RepID=A0A7I8KTU8_SPIIN|nr:unnamed protein product [Spirodela intermedia]
MLTCALLCQHTHRCALVLGAPSCACLNSAAARLRACRARPCMPRQAVCVGHDNDE